MVAENAVKLAVLIDADNAQPGNVETLLAEIAKYGTAHVKRAYGDWTGTNLKGWKEHLLLQSIQPIQQFAYTSGKNATDAAMVIDAMDLLYSGRFDGFCIVSSDSDFTRLAARIRESGLIVYGFGERKTPKPFVAACDKFIYTENLAFADEDQVVPSAATKPAKKIGVAALRGDAKLVNLLRNAVEAASDDDGWASLSGVGSILTKQQPDFDSRTYGYAKLSDLVSATGLFDVGRRSAGEGKPAVINVRDKRYDSRG
ncbi:MAG: Maebl [Catenulispora sp. 13_1_20CM_3_70_7]|nr:NYN domain-containing protein [Catenulisporales bacterium]OLE22298.1 MAG: Maebl [Catenulispora sp. 13_1_20CM_3_70_7]